MWLSAYSIKMKIYELGNLYGIARENNPSACNESMASLALAIGAA